MNQSRSAAAGSESPSDHVGPTVVVARKPTKKTDASKPGRKRAPLPARLERVFAAAESGKPVPRPKAQRDLARKAAAAVAARGGSARRDPKWAARLAQDLAAGTD